MVPARLAEDSTGTVYLIERGDDDILLASAKRSQITREQRLGSLPSVLGFPGGWSFQSHDHGKIDRMLGKRATDGLHALELFRPRLVLFVGLLFAAGFAVMRWGIGALVAIALFLTPDGLPRLIDDSHIAFVDQTLANPSRLDPQRKLHVTEVFDRVTAVAPEPRYSDYRLVFRDMPAIGPNAFALPGGTVLFTDQIVREYPDPDVMAGIIGHELIHVSEAHGLRQVYRSLGIYLVATLALGDVGPVLDDLLLEGGLLFSLTYSRDFEREADRMGVRLAAKAGYDPEALIGFLQEIEETYGSSSPEWLSTHPHSHDRIEEIEKVIDEIEASRQ